MHLSVIIITLNELQLSVITSFKHLQELLTRVFPLEIEVLRFVKGSTIELQLQKNLDAKFERSKI